MSCDVRADGDLERVFGEVGEAFGGELDLLVHSVAYAAAEDLEGRFTDTPRDRFWMALDVSAYSLVACARLAEPLMEAAGGGSILTMTYLGGERAVPHYNVMGVAKATLDPPSATSRGTWAEEHQGERDLGGAGEDARRALDRRLPDDGVDRRRALAAAPSDRRRRRRRGGGLPALRCGSQRHRHDAVRRRRVPLDGHVAPIVSPRLCCR